MSRYSHHYLTNVILRVDFATPVEQIKSSLENKVNAVCVKYFPIVQPQQVEIREVEYEVAGDKTSVNKKIDTEWHFFGKNREKELVITTTCVYVDFKQYDNFYDFKTQFTEILTLLLATYPTIIINRIGLRYIDQINMVGDKTVRKNWFSYWNKYIDTQLIQGLSFCDGDTEIARSMNVTEMNYDDYMLRFQYGIHNEDFPAPIKKPIFIIDTDVYATGLYSIEEFNDYVDIFHDKAKLWFEKSIKAALRTKMGVKE